jgi:hypothetical protein
MNMQQMSDPKKAAKPKGPIKKTETSGAVAASLENRVTTHITNSILNNELKDVKPQNIGGWELYSYLSRIRTEKEDTMALLLLLNISKPNGGLHTAHSLAEAINIASLRPSESTIVRLADMESITDKRQLELGKTLLAHYVNLDATAGTLQMQYHKHLRED